MIKRILLAIDLEHEGSWKTTVAETNALAKATGAEVHLLTVVPDLGMSLIAEYLPANFERKSIAKTEAKLEAFEKEHIPDSIQCSVHIAHGPVHQRITEKADEIDADLIVLAAYHQDLKDFLLGSTAEKVAHRSSRSVMLVRGKVDPID